MFTRLKNNKAQQTAEYAIIIGLVIAAAIAMQTYVKRGLQAKVHDAVNQEVVGGEGVFTTTQYEPYYLTSNINTESSNNEQLTQQGGKTTLNVSKDEVTRSGSQKILGASGEGAGVGAGLPDPGEANVDQQNVGLPNDPIPAIGP